MNKAVVLSTLAVVLMGLLLLGISNTSPTIANAIVLDKELTSNVSETNNNFDSASARITITMYALPDE